MLLWMSGSAAHWQPDAADINVHTKQLKQTQPNTAISHVKAYAPVMHPKSPTINAGERPPNQLKCKS